ncbi:MAG TPA: pilus assembly protein TadG-related protein, partial [Isosphaeraceae bacterium]|nr:pilus assembly protein TadG-related protein [Isosphaeraceae bacterium]
MRSWTRRALRHPRGMAAVLLAVLLPVVVGFAALSVDTAVVSVARAQMSTAADAAALAGAL